MPGRNPIRWNANQQARLKSAVAKYNAAVTRMVNSGRYDVVPLKTSYQHEKERIRTRDELYKRERQLLRVLVKNNKKALTPVEVNGEVAPMYLVQEERYARRSINLRRRKLLHELYPNWEEYTPVQKASRLSDKNLTPVKFKGVSGSRLESFRAMEYTGVFDYVDNYLAAWRYWSRDAPSYSSVEETIARFRDEAPDKLILIFEGNYDEATIDYIYPNSPYLIEFSKRQDRVGRFWTQMEEKYFGAVPEQRYRGMSEDREPVY